MENNQSASRAARRFLDERVRTDWSWPDVPATVFASDDKLQAITEFRERYYGDSSLSASDDEDAGDPYKFDSPDSIGDAVERKAQRRKRKRQRALEDEMKENDGLRIFVHRRDAWTGAAATAKKATASTSSNDQTPISPDSQASEAPPAPDALDAAPPSTIGQELLVPVAPRLLADNAIRKSISTKTYPDIYNKIVVSSRTPSVPINLSDMTKALVEGWKESGEWPPKPSALDPLVGRKRAAKTDAGEPFLAHHPHLAKGVDSVRKILHLSGPTREGGHGAGNAG